MTLRRILPAPPARLQPDISLFIINIVLLLILFFLATGQIINSSSVSTPLALTDDLPLDLLPSPLLEVTSDGSLRLDGADVADSALADALVGQSNVYIVISGDAAAQDLVDLLARPDLADLEIQLVTIANRSGTHRSDP